MTRAIRFEKVGGPDVLSFQEVTLAPPGDGEVRVRHTAIGVNFIDTYHRTGLYKLPLPSALGWGAGVVEQVGDGVTRFREGDRIVYATGPLGAYSEANNVVANRAFKIPDGVSDEIAASLMLKGLTAHFLLRRTHKVARRDDPVSCGRRRRRHDRHSVGALSWCDRHRHRREREQGAARTAAGLSACHRFLAREYREPRARDHGR
jgi:NADPH:quinone reductase-like Zn-dependent oxidoreductase